MAEYSVFLSTPEWHLSGVNTFARHLVHGLGVRGVRGAVLVTRPGLWSDLKVPYPPDVEIVELPVDLDAPDDVRRARLADLLKRHQPCVYVPNYDFSMSRIAPALPAGVVVVGILHSDEQVYYEEFRRLGDAWNATVCVSRHIHEAARRIRPDLAGRLRLIPYGVPAGPPPGSREARADGALRIVYCNRVEDSQKRALDLIPIVGALELRRVPFVLTIAGTGSQVGPLVRALRPYVDAGRVRFLGSLAQDAVAAELQRHDVFLLTSAYEGLPLSLLEAMQAECVPVVSDVRSGVPELVREGLTGFRVPIGDVESFADRLEALWTDPACRVALGRAAREALLTGDYTVERVTDQYLALFDRAWEEQRAGRGPVRPGRPWPPGGRDRTSPPRRALEAIRPLGRAVKRVSRRALGWPPGPVWLDRSCFLCATWRSGSTVFAEALGATGLVGHTERERFWLDPLQRSVAEVFERRALLHFCRELVRRGRTPNGVFGIKVMWPHLRNVLKGLGRLDEFRGQPERAILEAVFPSPGFVWIRRDDRIAQAISYYRATEGGLWHVGTNGMPLYGHARAVRRTIPYDYDGIAARLRIVENAERDWEAFFARNRLRPLVVSYEELSADLRGAVLRVFDFMGVRPDPSHIQPVPTLRRMAGTESATWAERFRRDLAARGTATPGRPGQGPR